MALTVSSNLLGQWGYSFDSPIECDGDSFYDCMYVDYPENNYAIKITLSCEYLFSDSLSDNNPIVHSVPETLSVIKDSLKLSMTDLAVLFNVTRPTIYAYIKDPTKKVGFHIEAKLGIMEQLVDKMKRKGIRIPNSSILYRRDAKGVSLKQAIIEETATESVIDSFVEAEYRKQNEKYPISSKRYYGKNLSHEEISTSLYPVED